MSIAQHTIYSSAATHSHIEHSDLLCVREKYTWKIHIVCTGHVLGVWYKDHCNRLALHFEGLMLWRNGNFSVHMNVFTNRKRPNHDVICEVVYRGGSMYSICFLSFSKLAIFVWDAQVKIGCAKHPLFARGSCEVLLIRENIKGNLNCPMGRTPINLSEKWLTRSL